MRNKRKHKSEWKKKAERWGQETRLRPEGDGWHQRGDIHLFRELRSNMLTRQTGGVTVDQLLLLHHVPSRTSPLTPIVRCIFNCDATSNRWGPAEESEQSWFSNQPLVLVLFFSFYISQNLSENESVSSDRVIIQRPWAAPVIGRSCTRWVTESRSILLQSQCHNGNHTLHTQGFA